MQPIIQQLKSKPLLVRLAAVLIVGVLVGYWMGHDGSSRPHARPSRRR